MHPLRLLSLLAWTGLFLLQASPLLTTPSPALIWPALLSVLLLLPLPGLIRNRRYTYRWIGFLALFYLCIGISELVAAPAARLYALGTTAASLLLFLASIYYARYLAIGEAMGSAGDSE